MLEQPFANNNLESEIAELSLKIEEKRRQLETENNMVSDKEVVKDITSEIVFSDDGGVVEKTKGTTPTSYLDSLDENTVSLVNDYINMVNQKGIRHTLKQLRQEDPFYLDVVHDALVDKLYEELKNRGLVK